MTNGGYNGVLAVLYCGTLLVYAGAGENKEAPDIGAKLTWARVGTDLVTGTPTDKALQDAVMLVLNDLDIVRRRRRLRKTSPTIMGQQKLQKPLCSPGNDQPP